MGHWAVRPDKDEAGQPAAPSTLRTSLTGLAPFARKFAESERGELVPLPWQPLCHIVTRLAGKEVCLKGARSLSIPGFPSRSGKWAPSRARPKFSLGDSRRGSARGTCCASWRAKRRLVAEYPLGHLLAPRRGPGLGCRDRVLPRPIGCPSGPGPRPPPCAPALRCSMASQMGEPAAEEDKALHG